MRAAAEIMQDLFELAAQLPDDLMALGAVLLGRIPGQLLPRPADRKALIIKQTANLPHGQDVMVLIVAPVAATLDGLELRELLLPIAQHMGLDVTKLADLANREIALGGDRRQTVAATARVRHRLRPVT